VITTFISFRKCLRCCHLQPADSIVICFVEAQQAAIQFCDQTRVDSVIHGLLLSAVTAWRWGKTPLCMLAQCPGMARQVEARLLDSRVAYKMTIDHSSWQPVFFSLRTLVDRSYVCPDRASSYKSFCGWSNTSAYRGQLGWASMLQSSLSVADLCRRAGITTVKDSNRCYIKNYGHFQSICHNSQS